MMVWNFQTFVRIVGMSEVIDQGDGPSSSRPAVSPQKKGGS